MDDKDIVYLVMNYGEPIYASKDKNEAENIAYNRNINAREEVLEDWGMDDPDTEDLDDAEIQAGFDGDYYEVVSVNIFAHQDDDQLQLDDGTEVDYNTILELLDKIDEDDFVY